MKLIVWDFDGTLADSRPLIEAGMAHALDALGQPRSVMAEWLTYVGLPVEEGIRRTFSPIGLDEATVLKAYRSFGHADHEHLMRPFEGVDELLHELRARGQAMAESLDLILKMTGLAAEELLMVGDTPFDLDMARAAGVPSLAVGHGFYSEPQLAACGPRAYAPDTAALRDILLAWSEPCPTT